MNRRRLLGRSALAVGGLLASSLVRRPVWAQGTAPAVVTADTMRPAIPYGVNGADDARRISERVVGGPLDEQARRPVGPAPHDRQPRQVHARREIALGERSLTTSPPA